MNEPLAGFKSLAGFRPTTTRELFGPISGAVISSAYLMEGNIEILQSESAHPPNIPSYRRVHLKYL